MSDDELPNHWDFLGNNPDDDPEKEPKKPAADQPTEAAKPVDKPKQELAAEAPSDPEDNYTYKVPKRRKKKRGIFMKFVVFPLIFFMLLGLVAFIAGAAYFHSKALTYDMAELKKVPERTLVYDRNGELMGHVSGHGQNRLIVSVKQVSDNFINPLLAREDMRFYDHGGVDYLGVARAAITNVKSGQMDQGASTLTMQLARGTFNLKDSGKLDALKRKAQEIAIARRLERKLEKDEILSYYVNRVYFGSGLYGIEKASQGFFMKPASELTLGEGAMLAGVIRGPSLLNPFRSIESAKGVRDETLNRMLAEEMITPEQAEAAKAEPINLRPPEMRFATGSYVLQEVHNFLGDALKTPSDPTGEEAIRQGGLRVFCTIDSKLQQAAEQGLENHLAKMEARSGWSHPKRSSHSGKEKKMTGYVQGAVVSLDNTSGAILAYVGGRSYNESPFNRAVHAKRQAGSTFKPFVYAVAFDRGGLLPGTYVDDGPYQYREPSGRIWSPKNYDGTYQGWKPAEWGLIKSRNTMTIRVGDMAGLPNILGLAKHLYFGKLPESPVIYLGAFEATPMTMTSAFSTFASGGNNHAPYLIERIENSAGKVLFQNKKRTDPAFRPEVAWLTSDVLGKVFTEGTARSARSTYGYTAPAYGKTGTTNDNKDAWFVGYTDKITTGVWVGMDNPKTIMYKGTGSSLALPVWVNVMKEAESVGYKAEPIAMPAGTAPVHLCRQCGLRASRRTTDGLAYQRYIPNNLVPSGSCRGHEKFSIFSKTPEWMKQQNGGQGGTVKAKPVGEKPAGQAFKRLREWFKKF